MVSDEYGDDGPFSAGLPADRFRYDDRDAGTGAGSAATPDEPVLRSACRPCPEKEFADSKPVNHRNNRFFSGNFTGNGISECRRFRLMVGTFYDGSRARRHHGDDDAGAYCDNPGDSR